MNPLARKSDLFAEKLPNEVVLYDKNNNKVHCLNKTAAAIWESADGTRTVDELAKIVAADRDTVLLAIEELEKADLLETGSITVPHPAVTSRREAVGKIALAGSVLVATIVAPSPSAATSGTNSGGGGGTTPPSQFREKLSRGAAGVTNKLGSALPAKLVK